MSFNHRRVFPGIAVLIAILISGMPVAAPVGEALAAPSASPAGDYCAGPEETRFLDLINAHRAERGAPPLALSQTLGAAAFHYSDDMATNNYIGGPTHRRLDGTTSFQNMQAHGYNPTGRYNVAENIAYGTETAVEAFDEWKSSTKGHNEIMLDPVYTVIGVGRSSNPSSVWGWYWTTTFGSQVDAPAKACQASGTTPSSPLCDGLPATMTAPDGGNDFFGTPGDDVIVGTANSDHIIGMGGNDRICGGGGNDIVDGHDGDDLVYGDGGNDQVLGGLGNDRLFGGDGDDHLIADEGNDLCDGGAGTDSHQNYGRGPCESIVEIESEVVR